MPGSNLFSKLSDTLQIALADENGLALLAKSTSSSLPTTAGVFQHGCLCIVTTGDDVMFINAGTSSSVDWKDPFSGGGGGDIELPSGNLLVGNSSDVAQARAITGDISVSSTGVTAIATGVIVDADIASNASIALSKLTPLGVAGIVVGGAGGGGTPAAVAMSGDATIASTGAVTIANAAISKAKLATSLQPSHIIVKAGRVTTAGGDATEVISDALIQATDDVVVTVRSVGVTPRTIVSAVTSNSTVTITMSGDPSTDHTLSYIVYRAAP